ncbi:MAG: DUF917 domain-containing protein [Clostridia bacterium]
MKYLDKQGMIDLLYGCTVLGTGGGGGLEEALVMMEPHFKANDRVKVVSLEELPDDEYVATPYGVGPPMPVGGVELPEKFRHLERYNDSPAVLAFEELQKYMGKKFFAVSATELGGLNVAAILHIACLYDIAIVDADPTGRSVPELQHSTYYLNNVPIAPMGIATEFGEVAILSKVADDCRAEDLVRAMSVASNDLVGVVDHPTTGAIYKKSVIPNTISYATKIGEILRLAKENGQDVAQNIAEQADGAILFKGVLKDMPWDKVDGFNVGEMHLDGVGDFAGNTYKIWFKNENLIAYKNGEVLATCPDLICAIDNDGTPVTNPDAKIGMEISFVLLPSPKEWQTKEGLDCFGPKYFGFDIEYTPYIK